MKVFKVEIEEVLQHVYEIEAETLDEAIAIAEDRYHRQEYVLDAEDYKGAEFREFKDEVWKVEIESICKRYSDKDFMIAVYLAIRYNNKTFKEDINDNHIDKISKEIKNKLTLFDEGLNRKIDRIIMNRENKMYFKVGEIRPYALGRIVYEGKIIKVDEEKYEYTVEDLETKQQYVLPEVSVFIGDD